MSSFEVSVPGAETLVGSNHVLSQELVVSAPLIRGALDNLTVTPRVEQRRQILTFILVHEIDDFLLVHQFSFQSLDGN